MRLNMDQAKAIVKSDGPPGINIKGAIEYQGMFLFLAPWGDPLEGNLDPFFCVDPDTREFKDFSPQDYDEDSAEVVTLLLNSTP